MQPIKKNRLRKYQKRIYFYQKIDGLVDESIWNFIL